MLKVKTQRFGDTDIQYSTLTEQYYFIMHHNLGDTNYLVSITDADGNILNTSNLFVKDSNQLLVNVPGWTIGTWTVQLYYEDGSQQDLSKKRLFEQDLIPLAEIPNYLDYNVALGKESTPTVNMTLSNLKSFCQSSLDSSIYLLKSNNLSDLNSIASARQNLDVYDKAYIDSYITTFIPKNGFIDTISAFNASGNTTYAPIVSTVKSPHGINAYADIRLDNGEGDTTTGINLGYIDIAPISGVELSTTTISSVLFSWFTTANVTTTTQNFTQGELRVVPSSLSGGAIRLTFTAFVCRPSGVTTTANCTASIFIPIQIND